jgi:hypothetical protein
MTIKTVTTAMSAIFRNHIALSTTFVGDARAHVANSGKEVA